MYSIWHMRILLWIYTIPRLDKLKRLLPQNYSDVITTINNVYQDVIYGNGFINEKSHPVEHHVFNNPFKVVDGPCYVFLVHGKGPAVGGQRQSLNGGASLTCSNIVIKDKKVSSIHFYFTSLIIFCNISTHSPSALHILIPHT